jgi:hypothetical protein
MFGTPSSAVPVPRRVETFVPSLAYSIRFDLDAKMAKTGCRPLDHATSPAAGGANDM